MRGSRSPEAASLPLLPPFPLPFPTLLTSETSGRAGTAVCHGVYVAESSALGSNLHSAYSNKPLLITANTTGHYSA